MVGGIADLAFPRQEDEHIVGLVSEEFLYGAAYAFGLVENRSIRIVGVSERVIAHLHRVGASCYLNDRGIGEVSGEASGVDRGGGDYHLEVGTTIDQSAEIAE